jgi:hypothetical protein
VKASILLKRGAGEVVSSEKREAGRGKFVRTPIGVEAMFLPDGSFVPKKLWYAGKSFEIIRVDRVRKYSPWQVRAVATTEYSVIIDDVERQIYYEPDTNQWFSIKEVRT